MTHQYKLGQRVRMTRGFPDRTGAGVYEIVRLLPAGPDGEFQYRVMGADKIERAVGESQILEAPDA